MKIDTSTRLKQIMNEKNLKQVDIIRLSEPFQKELNIKMGKSTFSQYVNGIQSPDQDRIFLLSKTLNVSEPWLMGYDVPRERVADEIRNSDSKNISTIYKQLNEPRQENVLSYAKKQLQEQEKEKQQENITSLEAHREKRKRIQKNA